MPPTDDDRELLDQGRPGDRERDLTLFAARYGTRLAAACRRLTGNATDGEDALQEVWIQINRSLGGFRGESDPYTWAFRIAVRVCLNQKRGLRARAVHVGLEGAAGALTASAAEGGDPDFSCAASFRAWVVERALLDLPAGQRQAVTLHDLEEMTAAETGALLGIDANAVKQRVHRGRKALRERIAREFASRGVAIDAVESMGCVSGLFDGAAERTFDEPSP
jgi:RNA polymerase sigma factor (sigma-70 family)